MPWAHLVRCANALRLGSTPARLKRYQEIVNNFPPLALALSAFLLLFLGSWHIIKLDSPDPRLISFVSLSLGFSRELPRATRGQQGRQGIPTGWRIMPFYFPLPSFHGQPQAELKVLAEALA